MRKHLLILLIFVTALIILTACGTTTDNSGNGEPEVEGNVTYYSQDDNTYLAVVSGTTEVGAFNVQGIRRGKPIVEVWLEDNVTALLSRIAST